MVNISNIPVGYGYYRGTLYAYCRLINSKIMNMVTSNELVQGDGAGATAAPGNFATPYIPPHMRSTGGGGGGGARMLSTTSSTTGDGSSDVVSKVTPTSSSSSSNERMSGGTGGGSNVGSNSRMGSSEYFRRNDRSRDFGGGGGGGSGGGFYRNQQMGGGGGGYRGRSGDRYGGGSGGGDTPTNRFRGGNFGGNYEHGSNAYDRRRGETAATAVNPLIAQNVDELFEKPHTGINFDKYDDIPVEMTGHNAPSPVASFEEAGFHPILFTTVQKIGFAKPTPVQKYSIAIGRAKRDIMACAQTGSGKTAAFLLPIFNRLMIEDQFKRDSLSSSYRGGSGFRRPALPDVLILAPTRELACQIYDECRKFSYGGPLKCAVVYGGDPIGPQMRALHSDLNVLVATPGRLLDIISNQRISLERVRFLVLDEADRMLDMGFEPQIRQIVEDSNMPGCMDRQTFMFSATFPQEIQRLARDFLNDYVFLTVGRVGAATENVKQTIIEVPEEEKPLALVDLLQGRKNTSVLIFVERRQDADDLADFLISHNFKVNSIHGDRKQSAREAALDSFKRGQIPILVATAVAARGLDIPTIGLVINFDMPTSIDEYVHRIGRTGRAGNTGEAISLINDKVSKDVLKDLRFTLKDNKQEVPVWFDRLVDRLSSRGYGSSSMFNSYRGSGGGPRGASGGYSGSPGGGMRTGGSGTLQETANAYRGNYRSSYGNSSGGSGRGFGGQDFRMNPRESATGTGSGVSSSVSSSALASSNPRHTPNPSSSSSSASGVTGTTNRPQSSSSATTTTGPTPVSSRPMMTESKSSIHHRVVPSAWGDDDDTN